MHALYVFLSHYYHTTLKSKCKYIRCHTGICVAAINTTAEVWQRLVGCTHLSLPNPYVNFLGIYNHPQHPFPSNAITYCGVIWAYHKPNPHSRLPLNSNKIHFLWCGVGRDREVLNGGLNTVQLPMNILVCWYTTVAFISPPTLDFSSFLID